MLPHGPSSGRPEPGGGGPSLGKLFQVGVAGGQHHVVRGIVGHQLRGLAERHCDGRIVSVLEGGYDPPALARSVMVHLQALSQETRH